MSESGRYPQASDHEVRSTQVDPVAGIWLCPNCGRRIQVITESETPKAQAFVCVCATRMEPGEEHSVLEPEGSKTVDE